MPTDIKEIVERWRHALKRFPNDAPLMNRHDLRTLLDAAEAGERARDAALEEIAEKMDEAGYTAISAVVRSLRRPG
jgi:hypothetical protein